MFQVRMYLVMARKYPRRGRGYYGYRLETIKKNGEIYAAEEYGTEEDITANQLALVMMYRAFERLKEPCEVEVFTDNMYLRSNFVQNLGNWTLNSWLNSRGEPVANGELWRALDGITEKHAVRFSGKADYPERMRMTKEVMERKEKDDERDRHMQILQPAENNSSYGRNAAGGD